MPTSNLRPRRRPREKRTRPWSAFDRAMSVCDDDIELELRGHDPAPWADFLLNPRKLRGSDFLMRWSQGVWSEKCVVDAVNATGEFFACPYGPSGTAPDDVREYELYFERLEEAGLGDLKRPDLLIFRCRDRSQIDVAIEKLGGLASLPFTKEDHPDMQQLLSLSVMAVECENSLWRSEQMKDYGKPLKPRKWLNGELGMGKSAVLPTVIVKEEDLPRLTSWQEEMGVPLHIWHVFFDRAWGVSLSRVIELIENGQIAATSHTFQAPGGATTTKSLFKVYYHYAYPLGHSSKEPTLRAAAIHDKNGHILPYVVFEGGAIELSVEALAVLRAAQ